MHKWVRTIGLCVIQKRESPFHALSDLSFYPHPENVYHQQIWYFLLVPDCFFSIVGAHIVMLVLRQYKVSVSNSTILQSYFYNKSARMSANISLSLHSVKICHCHMCIEVIWVPWDLWFQYSAYGALSFHTGEIPSFLLQLLIHLRPRFSSMGQEDHMQSMENL